MIQNVVTTIACGLDEILRVMDGANLIVHDFDGIVSHWTRGCELRYGWRKDTVIGAIIQDLLQTAFPIPLNEIYAILHAQGFWEGELTNRNKNGELTYDFSRWAVVQTTSGKQSILQTNVNISALKHSQERLAVREAHLHSILETAPDAMIVIDNRGLIASFNIAAERMFGYSATEVCGQNVKILMPSPDRENHDEYLSNYFRTGERRIIGFGRVVKGLKKDHTTFPMELSVGETIVNHEHLFTGFIRDLTSRHKIEEELRQAQKMEAIGLLTGGLAHDFNNLLTIIGGNLEMIKTRIHDKIIIEMVSEAQSATADGAKITEQLLAFGRRQPLNPRKVDIGDLINDFSGILRRSIGENIKLNTIISGGSHTCLVDASQFQNAILNLIVNARHAVDESGQITIEISRKRLDLDYAKTHPEVRTGEYVLIAVSDSGVGMSEVTRQRAFEPFFTTKSVGQGSGLGLSTVYGFVKQSDGHIQISSELGKGTRVELFLPSQPAPALPVQEDNAFPEAGEFEGGKETILVVEDDPGVRKVAVSRLRDIGYTVLEAQDGHQALALVDAHPEIRLIYTDVVLHGGMSGDEVAKAAKVKRPGLKVLFTSGYADPAIAMRELADSGIWLKKPNSAAELARTVRKLLK